MARVATMEQPTVDDNGRVMPERRKRKRSASVAKPAFFILQVLDDNGEPMPFDKSRIKLVRVERSAESVMDAMENSTYPHAFYLRGIVPVQRQAAPMKPSTEA